jgi:hypothetical protein
MEAEPAAESDSQLPTQDEEGLAAPSRRMH